MKSVREEIKAIDCRPAIEKLDERLTQEINAVNMKVDSCTKSIKVLEVEI